MTDQAGQMNGAAEGEQGQFAPDLPIHIIAQYIKDLSFENPHAPDLLLSPERAVMDVSFSMDARLVPVEGREHVYEAVLGVQTAARKGERTAFMCEVQYGVLVDMAMVPDEHRHPMLLIEMPRFAFPFVRQIVANLTQQAGYAPLLLSPADFRAFYVQRFSAEGDRQVAA